MKTAAIRCPNCYKTADIENPEPNSVGVCPYCLQIISINKAGKIELLRRSAYLKLTLETKLELQKAKAITPRV